MSMASIFEFVKTHLAKLLPKVRGVLPLLSVPALQNTGAVEEDPKLVELRKELDMLRAQMQQMSMGNNKADVAKAEVSEAAQQSQPQSKPDLVKEKPVSNAPRPLPFNAEMLISAKKSIKTPVKTNDRSGSLPKKPAPSEDKPDSIQAVLQRALQEKFKNVRLAEKEDLDSSFDGAGPSTYSFRSQSPVRQESNPWRATAQDTPSKKSEQKATRDGSENKAVAVNASKPQVPPRPKLSKVSAAEPKKKKILAEQNSY